MMAKRWLLPILLGTSTLLIRQGWIPMDWASIQRDLHWQGAQQIQEHSKNTSLEKALPDGLPAHN